MPALLAPLASRRQAFRRGSAHVSAALVSRRVGNGSPGLVRWKLPERVDLLFPGELVESFLAGLEDSASDGFAGCREPHINLRVRFGARRMRLCPVGVLWTRTSVLSLHVSCSANRRRGDSR